MDSSFSFLQMQIKCLISNGKVKRLGFVSRQWINMSLQPQWKWGAVMFYLDLVFWGVMSKSASGCGLCQTQLGVPRQGLGWAAQWAVYMQMSQSFKSLSFPAEIVLDPPLTGDVWIGKGKEQQLNATRDRWELLSLLCLFCGDCESWGE